MSTISRERGAAVRHAQRVAGQAAALPSMITRGRPFADIAQQLLAARGSLDSLLVRLVELELHDCVPSAMARSEVDRLLRSALGRSGHNRHVLRSPVRESPAVSGPLVLKEGTSP
jgi:DNA-binding FrmR family transcriptional regulator